MIAGIVLGALLAVGCVLLVALPYVRDPSPASDDLGLLDPDQRRLLELAEERDRALAALKELETDHRSGRIGDDDYRALIGPLRREAAEALRSLDARSAPVADGAAVDETVRGRDTTADGPSPAPSPDARSSDRA